MIPAVETLVRSMPAAIGDRGYKLCCCISPPESFSSRKRNRTLPAEF